MKAGGFGRYWIGGAMGLNAVHLVSRTVRRHEHPCMAK